MDEREGKGPVPIHSDIYVYASILSPTKAVTYTVPSSSTSSTSSFKLSSETETMPASNPRRVYIHVIQTSGYYRTSPTPLDSELCDAQSLPKTRATVRINGVGGLELSEGDGAFAVGGAGEMLEIDNVGEVDAEFLVFDVA